MEEEWRSKDNENRKVARADLEGEFDFIVEQIELITEDEQKEFRKMLSRNRDEFSNELRVLKVYEH